MVVGHVVCKPGHELGVGHLHATALGESQARRVPPGHSRGIIREGHARPSHAVLPGTRLDVQGTAGPLRESRPRKQEPGDDSEYGGIETHNEFFLRQTVIPPRERSKILH
jgi:hypothetical protein